MNQWDLVATQNVPVGVTTFTRTKIGDIKICQDGDTLVFDMQPDITPEESLRMTMMFMHMTVPQSYDWLDYIRKYKLERHWRNINEQV